MIVNLLLQTMLEIIKGLLSPFLAVVPLLDGILDNSAFQALFSMTNIAFGILSFIAGSSAIVVFPIILNTSLLVAELSLSFIWWIIYKLPFLGIKK